MKWLWMATLLGISRIAFAQSAPVLVELSPEAAGDALIARYTLTGPVTEFRLDASNAPQRRGTWVSQGSEWVFDGVAIHRVDGAAFSRFELRVRSDRQLFDRRYISIDRVGESGWAIFLESFRAADLATQLRIPPHRGYVVRAGARTWKGKKAFSADLVQAGEHIVYFGPSKYIAPGRLTVIAGSEVPAWLIRRLRADAGMAIKTLTAHFGAPPGRPAVILTYSKNWEGATQKGDAMADSVFHLSLRGMNLDEADRRLADELTNTVIHETVHFWNGGRWESSANDQQPWLHEGSAEYLAARLWRTPEGLRNESARRLNACLNRPNRRPMNGSAGPVTGVAPYDCGFAIQLFAEVAARQSSKRDIFGLWKTVFARTVEGRYSPETFLEVASEWGPGFANLATALLGNPDTIDRQQLLSGMRRIGVEATERQPDAREGGALRVAGMFSVLDSVCKGSRGFSTAPDRLILDTGDRCGEALAGDPAIVSVNGVDLMRSPVEAYAVIRAACGAGGKLIFVRPDGVQLKPLECVASVPPPKPVIELTALPDLQ
jgi:hypothetical protein